MKPDKELLRINVSPFDGAVGGTVTIECPEFTHLDPDSDIPHLASVQIMYVPKDNVIDAESFGKYLRTYRDFSAKPENSIALLCQHIADVVEPMQVKIQTRWSPRAGVAANPTAQWIHPDLKRQAQGGGPPGLVVPGGGRLQ